MRKVTYEKLEKSLDDLIKQYDNYLTIDEQNLSAPNQKVAKNSFIQCFEVCYDTLCKHLKEDTQEKLELEGWRKVKLGDVIEVVGGGTPSTKKPEYWNGDIPWLSPPDFTDSNRWVTKTRKTITPLGLKNSATKILKEKSLIISARGTVGALAQLKKPMAFSQTNYGLKANSKFTNNDFLFYALKHNLKRIKQFSYGAVFDTITTSTFNAIEVSLPPIPEQKAIAEVLSSIDDKIDLLHRQNKTLEDMAQTLFRQWFVEEAVEYLPLGDCIKTTSGGTPSRKRMDFYKNGEYQWVKSKELNGGYILDTEEKITEEALNNSSAKLLPKNSVLIAMYGATVGQFAVIGQEASCNQAICACIPNDEYPYTFIYHTIKSNVEELKNRAVGSAQQNISQILIKSLEIAINFEQIKLFHAEVDPMMKKIKANYKQIHTLENLREALLPKLMSGSVRVGIF